MSGHPTHDDGRLLNEFCATRSEAAFTELVRRHLPLVFHVALRRLGSAALAEEAAQHAFARLAAKAAAVARHPERLRAWLHRTAYFEASTLARKESRLSRLPIITQPTPEPMNRPEIYDRLDELLNKLPELDRELVLRHCCGGEDYRRMAAAVGKSEAACQKRVERALARLGQKLGGTRTAGVVFAAFAATSMKSQAMPTAERVAAAALKYHGATGGVAGAVSGAKIAACAAIAMAGGVAGWQPQEAPPELVSPEMAGSTSPRRAAAAKAVAISDTTPLAPRPLPVNRSLDEVLETIQAGRLAPLIEFLPQATLADLRAIMAEDDIYPYGEQDGKEHFSTARNLALLRWAEIDPAAAFQYGRGRDHEHGGYWLGDSAAVLTKWLQADPGAAVTALEALPLGEQVELTRLVFDNDPDAADHLATMVPKLAWVVTEQHIRKPDPETKAAQAEKIVAGISTRTRRDKLTGYEFSKIRGAFHLLSKRDPGSTLARAKMIPWQDLRNQVLVDILVYQGHTVASADLAPGWLRHQSLTRETQQLMATDPEAAIRQLNAIAPGADRDAILQAITGILASSDPWRFLEMSASSDGRLAVGSVHFGALEFAGRTDPLRALRMLPEIAARSDSYGGTRRLTATVVSGWIEKDPASAIRWAAKAGLWFGSDDMKNVTGSPQPLISSLSDESDQVRRMVRNALYHHVADAHANGDARGLLGQMPQMEADQIVSSLALRTSGPKRYEEALQIAALASPAARQQEILPQMALFALRHDHDGALGWIHNLSAADRAAIVTGVERLLNGTQYGGEAEIRQGLQFIQP